MLHLIIGHSNRLDDALLVEFLQTFPGLEPQPSLVRPGGSHSQYGRDVRGVYEDEVQVGGGELLQEPPHCILALKIPEVSRAELGGEEQFFSCQPELGERGG